MFVAGHRHLLTFGRHCCLSLLLDVIPALWVHLWASKQLHHYSSVVARQQLHYVLWEMNFFTAILSTVMKPQSWILQKQCCVFCLQSRKCRWLSPDPVAWKQDDCLRPFLSLLQFKCSKHPNMMFNSYVFLFLIFAWHRLNYLVPPDSQLSFFSVLSVDKIHYGCVFLKGSSDCCRQKRQIQKQLNIIYKRRVCKNVLEDKTNCPPMFVWLVS